MAIAFSLSKIEARLDSMKSKKERVDYLRKYLFELEKQRAEFNVSDAQELKRLIPITQADFEKYHGILDAGKLISLAPPNDRFHADKFQNIGLLRKRIGLEHRILHIESLIELFEARLKLELDRKGEPRLANPRPEPTTFNELFTTPHWAETFRKVLRIFEPALIDENNKFIGPHGFKGLVPMLIEEIEIKGGMEKHPLRLRIKILNETFPGLKINDREFRYSKLGKYKKLEGKFFDIESWVAHFSK
jgi:hypothetical protein